MMKVKISTFEELKKFAIDFKKQISIPNLILLEGTLGAGKTTFVQYFVSQFAIEPSSLRSPTYSLVHRYSGDEEIIHADLYRIENLHDLQALNLLENLDEGCLCLVEWANLFSEYWPKPCWKLKFYFENDERWVECDYLQTQSV